MLAAARMSGGGCGGWRLVVGDSDVVAGARAALGWESAGCGLSQEQLAPLSGYSRSTIANAETGRQRVPRGFWEHCDAVLGAGTALSWGHDQVERIARRGHAGGVVIARQDRIAACEPVSVGVADVGDDGSSGGPPGSAGIESMRRWLDGVRQ